MKESASSFPTAKKWLLEELTKHSIDGVLDIYHKASSDDQWNGMVFLKFSTAEKRDAGICAFNAIPTELSEKAHRMKEDRPLQERVKFNFLYGLKKLITEMGTRTTLDADTYTMSFNGVAVLQVHVHQQILKMDWLDPDWANWNDLVQNEKFKSLCDDAKQKLDRAKAPLKGDGKGQLA